MKAWCDDSTCKHNSLGLICTKEQIDLERMTFENKVYVVCKDYEKEDTENG